ncbi:MAG: hypothetical protein GXP24_11070 [Planctomycetes bacterium]|nr:hypothetical protein [Planctomycetota bacterium]
MLPYHHLLVVTLCFLPLARLQAETSSESATAQKVERLVRQLNDDQATRRDEAEQTLLKLAPTDNAELCDAFLEWLPKPIEGMPAEVRLRLARVRKQIETEQSSRVMAASRITLSAKAMELGELFELIQKQTGNLLTDHREQFGQEATPRLVTIELDNEPFWPALDKILDAANMTVYPYSGEETLAVIDREQSALPRAEGASYAGPFRIQAVNVVARRNLRSPAQQGTHVELEIAWEPRLRPIALSQPIESLAITADDGSSVAVANTQAVLNVEVQPGSHATELTIPLVLPPRSVTKLASFQGKMSALVPGRLVEFKFHDLEKPKGATQSRGGVEVILNSIRKNQELWEVHMRLKVNSTETGLESHRGWVFSNLTYLLNKQGEIIDHAGFETTMQTETEVGLAYFFDLPDDDLSEYTWVYRTPAAIVRMPVEYELKDILLP